MCSMVVGYSLSVHLLAHVSVILFHIMPKCACILRMWIVCEVQYIWCTIAAINNLSRW